ncbi:MAG: hypothetical protein EA369_01160 [Bradymonadales bacterium]|nr:MAG: hypothetical protein EA369_01160 [Bradymonadales bacterium]
MQVGIGFSQLKDPAQALQEAQKKAHQELKALQADLYLVCFTYDHSMDLELLSSLLKRNFRSKPLLGCSTWSAWSKDHSMEAESGLFVLAFRELSFEPEFLKVNSLKEKQGLWAVELARQIEDRSLSDALCLFVADSLHFHVGTKLQQIQESMPQLPILGWSTSYGIPQCSVVLNSEIYSNALVAMAMKGVKAEAVCIQSVQIESQPIQINRMSENLVIEIDQKPAFYRLCEHLVEVEDLPMMAQDEFRKHMGNLYLIESAEDCKNPTRFLGEAYRCISLLGSEMTTGMVAVSEAVDFSKKHYLGQKKPGYLEKNAERLLGQLREKIPHPSFVLMISAASHSRERTEGPSNLELVSKAFPPETKIFGISSQAEIALTQNQSSVLVIAFE